MRASNLQDLVYKNGQAGITKASVSITFDNSDKKQSPLGFEAHDEITVTRQVSRCQIFGYLISCNTISGEVYTSQIGNQQHQQQLCIPSEFNMMDQ